MSDKTGKKVQIEIGEDTFDFTIDINAYNAFVNAFLPNNKVAPAFNFATTTVKPEQQAKLIEWLDKGIAVDVANHLAEEFKPAVKIAVKKSHAA